LYFLDVRNWDGLLTDSLYSPLKNTQTSLLLATINGPEQASVAEALLLVNHSRRHTKHFSISRAMMIRYW
jgi:hypothetical protein